MRPTSHSDAAPQADPNLLTRSQFAAANNWSKSYVTKLGNEGRLVLTEDSKLVKVKESLALIAATTGAPERAAPQVQAAAPPVVRVDRDRKEFYDAENARVDFEERIGKLMVRAEVLAVVADVAVTLRSRLETWPHRLAPQLAALGGDEAAIRAVLTEHVQTALGGMADRFNRLAAQPGTEG